MTSGSLLLYGVRRFRQMDLKLESEGLSPPREWEQRRTNRGQAPLIFGTVACSLEKAIRDNQSR